MKRCPEEIKELIAWTEEVTKDATQLVLQVSGGSDGALALYVLSQACPSRVVGQYFGERLRAKSWFEGLAPIEYLEPPRTTGDPEIYRWARTASDCILRQAWPVSSRNRTEQVLGTYSRASNQATVFPIVGLWKSDVMRLCRLIGVPGEVLASSRRPDPACGRPSEMTDIGIERIDAYLQIALGLRLRDELDEFSDWEVDYLQTLLGRNEFKKALPLIGPNVGHQVAEQ